MTTVLQYLVIAGGIGLVVFGIAVFVFGRGEQLAPLSPRMSPTELPDEAMSGEDVRKVRFAMAVRGYRMSDVDWALERMADELDRLNAQVAEFSGAGAPAGDPDGDADHGSADLTTSADSGGDTVLSGVPGGSARAPVSPITAASPVRAVSPLPAASPNTGAPS